MTMVSGDNDLSNYRSLQIRDDGSIVEACHATVLEVRGLSHAKYSHCGG